MKYVLFAIPLLAVPLLLGLHQAKTADKDKRPAAETALPKKDRPPIDKDVPDKIETATFALG
jgi:hypothetical protein